MQTNKQSNKQTNKQTREFINMLVGHVLWHEEKKKELKSLGAESRALRFSAMNTELQSLSNHQPSQSSTCLLFVCICAALSPHARLTKSELERESNLDSQTMPTLVPSPLHPKERGLGMSLRTCPLFCHCSTKLHGLEVVFLSVLVGNLHSSWMSLS